MARKPDLRGPGGSLRQVNESARRTWVMTRRRRLRELAWWALPLAALCGVVATVLSHRVYFGVGFAVLLLLAVADVATLKPGTVSLPGRRAGGEAATARAVRPLRQYGFVALHDRRLPPNSTPGIPPVDIEHLLIGPAGVFLLDSKNWLRASPKFYGSDLYIGRQKRDDAFKRVGGDAQNLAFALKAQLHGVRIEPVLVIHVKEQTAKELGPLPRILEGVTMMLPEQLNRALRDRHPVMSQSQAAALARSLDAMLAPRTGDRAAGG